MPYQVAIVGAGLSGLYAACNLIDRGITDIVILEAQERLGGRLYSIPLQLPDHTQNATNAKKWVELGAQFIHGSYNNHLYNFCNNNKV